MIANSEYLIGNNTVYSNLNEYYEEFCVDAELMETAKCALLNYGKLEEFDLSEGTVYVQADGEDYYLEYHGNSYHLEVEDNMIVNYDKY